MRIQPLQRPIGFAPSEISALVNEEVVSQHAEEAAFLWTMRNRAVSEPHYSLADLTALDERVEAHLDGLRISGEVGWKYCSVSLENLGVGEVFALSVMAFGAGDLDRMRGALHAACSSPKTLPGLVSALGWLGYRSVSQWIARLLGAKSPLHRMVGISACAAHRADPGPILAAFVDDPDPVLRARSLRAVGELKRHDLVNHVRGHLRDEDDACRFWAAWALALNGERDGLSKLAAWCESDGLFSEPALQLALRAISLRAGQDLIRSLAADARFARSAVIGAGIVGDPASVPWLIRRMEFPELARLAGQAFTMITGVDLAFHDLNDDAPTILSQAADNIDEVLDLDYESNLAWPSPARVSHWWEANHEAFSQGSRYLAGKPITQRSVMEVLLSGKQRQRVAAALELALLNPDQPLFEVRAPGNRQQRMIARWSS